MGTCVTCVYKGVCTCVLCIYKGAQVCAHRWNAYIQVTYTCAYTSACDMCDRSWAHVYRVYTNTCNPGREHTILSNVNFFHVFGYRALQAKISAITWALWRVMAIEARHSIRPTRAALRSTLAGSHLMVVRARAFRADQSKGTC